MTTNSNLKIRHKMASVKCDIEPSQDITYRNSCYLPKSTEAQPSLNANIIITNPIASTPTFEMDHVYPCVYSVLFLITIISLLGDMGGVDGNAYSLLRRQFNFIFKIIPGLISLQFLSVGMIWLIIRFVHRGLNPLLSHLLFITLFTILIYCMNLIKSNTNTFALSCACVLETIRIMMKTYAIYRSFYGFLYRHSTFMNYLSSPNLPSSLDNAEHILYTNVVGTSRTLAPNTNRSLINTLEATNPLISKISSNVSNSNNTSPNDLNASYDSLKDNLPSTPIPRPPKAVAPETLSPKGHIPYLISLLTHSYEKPKYSSGGFNEKLLGPYKVNEKLGFNDNFSLPLLIYYYYSPTMIYKSRYNKKKERSTKKIIIAFLKCLWKLYLAAYLINSYTIRFLDSYIQNGGTHSFLSFKFYVTLEAFYRILGTSLSMLVLFVLLFRMFFIHWLDLWSELLMYNDQPLYLDWWTSYNYKIFLRKWNPVIQEWLWLYIYHDLRNCYSKSLLLTKRGKENQKDTNASVDYNHPDTPKSFILAPSRSVLKFTLILLSAIIHELIIYHILGVFRPVILTFFGIICPLLSLTTVSFGSVHDWTIIFLMIHGIGLGIVTTLYYEHAIN